MILSDDPPRQFNIVRFANRSTYLSLMSGSTLRRSLKPIPHGLPGVDSNINRPNSGWKIGSLYSLDKSAEFHTQPYRTTLRYFADPARIPRLLVILHLRQEPIECRPVAKTIAPFDAHHQVLPPDTQPARNWRLQSDIRKFTHLVAPK